MGERQFWTLASTLTEELSNFSSMLSNFSSMLSVRWPSARLGDGSFFVDTDPDFFEHILRYLRRGIPPIFWKRNEGI